jgi:hypothetical protein
MRWQDWTGTILIGMGFIFLTNGTASDDTVLHMALLAIMLMMQASHQRLVEHVARLQSRIENGEE